MGIAENLAQVRQKIDQACKRAGRKQGSVRLIAVSKTWPLSDVLEAHRLGQIDFGENYVQEADEKIRGAAGENIRWHMIGHLQSNKAKIAARLFDFVQSVDSVKLARELDARALLEDRRIGALIEVNIGDEGSKSGCRPEDTRAIADELLGARNLDLLGLMVMPPYLPPEQARPFFAKAEELRKRLIAEGVPEQNMIELSMGLSHDFETAIEEGATMVRVGTAIFGSRS